MKKHYAFIFVLCVLLGGCSLIPDYEQPEFTAAATWHTLPGYSNLESQKAVQDLTWQEFFKAPSLQKVISIALENNKDLKLAALNIQEARAQYNIERSDIVPNFDANGNATYQKRSDEESGSSFQQQIEIYEAKLGLSAWELDLFGRLRSQNQAALSEYLATKQGRAVVQNTLIAETANAYLQFLADRELLALTQKTLKAQEKTHRLLSESLEKGAATGIDVARAATAVETARVNLHKYQRMVAQDKNALITLMGIKYDAQKIPEAGLTDINITTQLDPGLPSDVLLVRPDVRQAEYDLLARNADIGAARAAFFPRITLTGSYGYASEGLSDLFTGGAVGSWGFLPQITLPIFQGGRNQANLELAEIRKDKAITTYEKTIQTAFREVADALAARSTLTEQLGAQKRLVAATQTVYDKSNARYKAGVDNFLSVLDAQRELYTAEQNEILIRRQRLSNLINLYKALGGGIRNDGQPVQGKQANSHAGISASEQQKKFENN